MTPANLRSIPLDVAEIAVAHADQRGEFLLLQSEVRQAIQTFSSQLNGVVAEQERARQERGTQTLLLQSLSDKSAGHSEWPHKVRTLELAVSEWKGVVKGALWAGGGALALALAFIVYRFDGLDERIQRVEFSRQGANR